MALPQESYAESNHGPAEIHWDQPIPEPEYDRKQNAILQVLLCPLVEWQVDDAGGVRFASDVNFDVGAC